MASIFLKAKNPFDKTEEIWGCPKCFSINTLVRVCDEPNCKEVVTCGWRSDKGYRQTCGKHWDGKKL